MTLRTVTNEQLLEASCYEEFVHDIVQTALQKYFDKYNKRPKAIYLNHQDAKALVRWSYKLANKTLDLAILEECSFCNIPIIFEDKPYLFKEEYELPFLRASSRDRAISRARQLW